MRRKKPRPALSDRDRYRRTAHCLDSYQHHLNLANADLTEQNHLRLLFGPQFQGDRFNPAPAAAELEKFARANRPLGGRPFDPRDALERVKLIQAYIKRVLDRLLAGAADPLRDPATGKIDLELPLPAPAFYKPPPRRPYGPDLGGKTPAVFVDERGAFPADTDFEDYWYHMTALFVNAHRSYARAPRCERPVVGCSDPHSNDPEAKRRCPGLRHLPFRPLRKSDLCGHFHFRPRGRTCSRRCTLALYYKKRRKLRRPRPRPPIPAPRDRRKTHGARFAQHSS